MTKYLRKISTPSKVGSTQVIDSLNSTSKTDALSADAGRELNKKLENLKFKTLFENWDNPIRSNGATGVIEDLSNYDILYCICGPSIGEVSTVTCFKGTKRNIFYMYVNTGWRASYHLEVTSDNKMSIVVNETNGWPGICLFKIVGIKYE